MKLLKVISYLIKILAAAFGRLCVETVLYPTISNFRRAAAFGRLCVETMRAIKLELMQQAAAFGRLCVETPVKIPVQKIRIGSRLRAAVC